MRLKAVEKASQWTFELILLCCAAAQKVNRFDLTADAANRKLKHNRAAAATASSRPCCYLNVHHSEELSWTIQTVETSLLHQLTHNLIGYLRDTGGGDKDVNSLIGWTGCRRVIG